MLLHFKKRKWNKNVLKQIKWHEFHLEQAQMILILNLVIVIVVAICKKLRNPESTKYVYSFSLLVHILTENIACNLQVWNIVGTIEQSYHQGIIGIE